MGVRRTEIRGDFLHGLRVMLLSGPPQPRWRTTTTVGRCKWSLRPRRFVYGAAETATAPSQSRTVNSISALRVGALSLILLALALEPIVVGANAHSAAAAEQGAFSTTGHPKDEFSRHFVIKPQVFHGRHKRAISNTLDEAGSHASHITLSYVHNGDSVIADLKLNEELIPQGHFLRYQNGGTGENAMKTFNKTDINLCHYQGAIRGKANSRVAVSTCNGINGLVYDGTESYYIYSDSDGELHSDHYLFRNSDKLYNATCGVHSDHNHEPEDFLLSKTPNRILRYKRSSKTENIIRGPYNANRHSSFVELVIVVDNKVYKGLGENMKKVHNHCKDIANIVNALYVPLNIFVALVGVVVWNESNEIELSSDGDDTLKKFLQYRRNSLLSFPNDNAQLLTKEQFDGGVVGKALKGPICTYEYSGGVSMEHSQITAIVATTVAHEMGHNFGMEHDSTDCKCEEEKCIMSASSTSLVPHHWSSCSIDQLNVAFSHGMNYCLRNRPAKLFESPQCGNGFVEPGEQCDCGLPDSCENTCCDPNTCMLHGNASCATGECCDLTTCRPKNPGTECRSGDGECDLPEFCTGESEFCPTDVYRRDTEACDNGNAYCYKGSCRSRTNQCKILWGPSGESSDHCYGKNVEGNRHGTCRYDRLKNEYHPCVEEDVLCGMLHCKHLNERLEFGMESVAILSHSFMNHEGTIIPCRTAIVDLGLQSPDPGLAPNGAKCGMNKMCVNQKCVAIEALQKKGAAPRCPNDCNGQGVCNSEGHCHCNLGYAYPDCSNPGQGGSVDSGPASNPNGRIVFTRAMYIIFLGCVPCLAIISFLTYYWKQNHPLQFRKATNVTKVTLKKSPPSPPSNPSTEDMNSALLKPQNDEKSLQNSMFGKFKGFTLRPLPNATTNMTNNAGAKVALVHPVAKTPDTLTPPACPVPIRSAPPVPKRPLTIIENENENVKAMNSMKVAAPPALPPPNAALTGARPLISEPVLKTSTCTAKELESLKQTAPTNENATTRHVNAAHKIAPQVKFQQPETTKDAKEGTIKRIASFLKSDKKPNNTALAAKHSFKAKPIINREKLKDIQISSPIPIVDGDLNPPGNEQTTMVQRTQSMRDPTSFDRKANVQTFGSLRQPGAVRPKSVVGLRPKSPPPRPPVPPTLTGSGKPSSYLRRPVTEIHDISSSESDNIYAEVDEFPHSGPNDRPHVAGSDDSMGLLSEIVNEMEKKNGQTIYSNTNVNTERKLPETSSPENSSASNVIQISATGRTPVARVAPNVPDTVGPKSKPNTFSSFKADRPPTTFKNQSKDTLSSAKTKPDSQQSVTKKPPAAASNQQGPQIVNKPSTKKTNSSTTKPLAKPADTSSSSSSTSSSAAAAALAASVPAGKKNLVSQRAELWEGNSKGKLGNKVSNSTSSSSSNSQKSSSADKTSSSTTSDPSKSSSSGGGSGAPASTKSATINKRVKSFTSSAAAAAAPTSSSAGAPAKPHTSLNKRKVGDSQASNVSASVNRFELKTNKLDNATNVRFATNSSNNSSASSSSKPNNSASA